LDKKNLSFCQPNFPFIFLNLNYFCELELKLKKMEKRLNLLEKRIKILENLAIMDKQFLGLPYHLLTTFLTVYKLGEPVTALDVSYQTKRERAVESAYLNQLVTMGYLKKNRKKRKVYFEINYNSKLTKNLLKTIKR